MFSRKPQPSSHRPGRRGGGSRLARTGPGAFSCVSKHENYGMTYQKKRRTTLAKYIGAGGVGGGGGGGLTRKGAFTPSFTVVCSV